MRSKFSTFVLASATLAAVALATLPAMAETSTTLNVPFSFTINGQSLPAGTYSVPAGYPWELPQAARQGCLAAFHLACPPRSYAQ